MPRRAFLQCSLAVGLGAAGLGAGLTPRGARAQTPSGPAIALVRGWNAEPWLGAAAPVSEAFAELPLKAAYRWNAEESRWHSYRPGAPASDLETIEYATPVWLLLDDAATWQQPPLPLELPADVALPVGWSFVSWLASDLAVWVVFGETSESPVSRVARWNAETQRFALYRPGTSAVEEFAILHPGDALWVLTNSPGVVWNPVIGMVGSGTFIRSVFEGTATYLDGSLHENGTACGGTYDRLDPTFAAATSWPCGTRLRIWRGMRSLDVVVQDMGYLGAYEVDLSEAGFQQIAEFGEGRVAVRIEVLPSPALF